MDAANGPSAPPSGLPEHEHAAELNALDALAQGSLVRWHLPAGATARRINVSENTTYLVEASGRPLGALRIHRAGYHTRRAIESELVWIAALRQDGVVATPAFVPGRDGHAIQEGAVAGLEEPRRMVLFEFVPDGAPDEAGDLVPGFEALGRMAARCHEHAGRWKRPEWFERPAWDENAVFGRSPIWGDWRDGPNLTRLDKDALEEVERMVVGRLSAYGKGPERYGLIHADMRLANLIVGPGEPTLIDFDDCGFGWFAYDFAAAISFMEADPRVPALREAWVLGYRTARPLAQRDVDEIGTFVMLRRMALLAWIGSHMEAPEPQALAPGFAAETARLGRAYLERFAST